MKRTTGGSAGAVAAGVERRERVEAGELAQQQELQDAQAQRVREPAEPEHRADVGQRQRGAGSKPSAAVIRANSAPVRLHAAHSVGSWPNSVWLVSVRKSP